MADLTAAKPRKYGFGDVVELSQGAVKIWEGMAVALDANGDVVVPAAGLKFAGFAMETKDAPAAAGDNKIKVRFRGMVELKITDISDDDDGLDAVYASDSDTFTVTQAADLTYIGKVVQLVDVGAADLAIVQYNAMQTAAKVTAAGATYTSSEQGSINAIISALEEHGIVIPN